LSLPQQKSDNPPFDVAAIRDAFPFLAHSSQSSQARPLAYLDNAATSQKPRVVLDEMTRHYTETNANVHRGAYGLSERATAAFESARDTVRQFLNAQRTEEIVFLRGTTEAINLVAQSFVRPQIGPGDEILITEMEHHSNIVPWQILRDQTGVTLRVVPIDDDGVLQLDELGSLLTERTKIVSLTYVSNVLGTINSVEEIISRAKQLGVPVMIDAAQAAPHLSIDVQALGCDFLAFSGHKVYGPMGSGALYGRHEHLKAMAPYQGGGEMIATVSFDRTTYNDPPHRFEAGTPNVPGAVGLATAIDYLSGINRQAAEIHEMELLRAATRAVEQTPGARVLGRADNKVAVLSFVIKGIHPHDIGTILDSQGIAIRTGHHCAEPLMQHFGIPASARASFAIYNTLDEVEQFSVALREVLRVMG
jgi:cysteine desulfurase/selenocysteine lyase